MLPALNSMPKNSRRRERANAIRALAMDAVEAAKSGHPGAPMGLADLAEVLWTEVMKYAPHDPEWIDRDRFVLSNGHASMLLYAVLHLTGYDLSIDEIRNFRQLGSKTPGHPEFGHAPGVETTTGPLGQGLANAVGMALAEQLLAQTFNRDQHEIINHRTYVIAGDGCLMEGVSHEAASFAGTARLGKLTCIYDDNNISIDGEVRPWYTEDVASRFESYGWHVLRDVDGHDPEAVLQGLAAAEAESDRPTLICCRTTIGFGAPNKAGTASTHGAPLGGEEVAATREALGWSSAPFEVPEDIKRGWDQTARGQSLVLEWQSRFQAYQRDHPRLAAELIRRMRGELPEGWNEALREIARGAHASPTPLETRKALTRCLDACVGRLPELIGGSADLSGSNGTKFKDARALNMIERDQAPADYVHWGVREFGMTAMTNGMLLHGGLRPFTGTFLVFMEYARNAVRLASLMNLPNILVYTHDSVGLGEDGPTHQPIEQLTNLRTTPNFTLWRPCDLVETCVAVEQAIMHQGPTALVLTRQKTEGQARNDDAFLMIERGGYVLMDANRPLDAILIATGSEVELAVQAARQACEIGIGVRVVSMPSTQVFDRQSEDYRNSVLPPEVKCRLAVEAGHPDYWRRYVGLEGAVVGIERFGVSAPGGTAMRAMGMTVEAVLDKLKGLCAEIQPAG